MILPSSVQDSAQVYWVKLLITLSTIRRTTPTQNCKFWYKKFSSRTAWHAGGICKCTVCLSVTLSLIGLLIILGLSLVWMNYSTNLYWDNAEPRIYNIGVERLGLSLTLQQFNWATQCVFTYLERWKIASAWPVTFCAAYITLRNFFIISNK